jgi:hypothetical protein
MTATETIFQNLFTLLRQTQMLTAGAPNGTPAFLTTSRVAPQVSAAGQATQPAFYQMEGEQDVMENVVAAQKYELKCAAIVLFRNTLGPPTSNAGPWPSSQLNALRDAVIYQLQQQTLAADQTTVVPLLGGQKQTLGGVVYHARVKGRILVNEGLQNQQGALVFPISILSGM